MKTSRRLPALALAAGLLVPGLGHVYAGPLARGLGALLGVALLPVLTGRLALAVPVRWLSLVVCLGALAGVGLYAWSVRDAWRCARQADQGLRPWQRPLVYLLAAFVAYLFVLAPFTAYARDNLLETFQAPTASMLPTIEPGDRFLADKRVNRPGGIPLARGDVALFVYPNNRTMIFVKRIIGLPGDTIEIDGTSLRVNGRQLRGVEVQGLGSSLRDRLLADHWAYRESSDRGAYTVLWKKDMVANQLSLVVPNAQVFVLGDNRGSSIDSRQFGVVPVADVKAVARQVLFSYRAGEGLRWSRLGKTIE
ncbi:MAG: signal peptidase I [Polyangia bacterium]|jgi:signal peptidase I